METHSSFTDNQEHIARIAKALGHPIRVAIIKMLSEQKCCYHGDMSEVLPIAKSTLSQHLKELKDAGLIQGTIDPPVTKYCINREGWKVAKELFNDLFQWEPKKMKVLILCTGNSCRSQMAHGFLQSFDSSLTVRSAGTMAAGRLNEGAVRVMAEVGIDISHHTSDPVEMYLGEEWDYVITVCGGANEVCPTFTGKVKSRLHIGFDDPSHATGTEEFIESEFRRVRDEIKESFYNFYLSNLK